MPVCVDNKECCCGCGACAVACPRHCIQMVADSEGFDYPVINYRECVKCGRCVAACGMQGDTVKNSVLKTYAAWHTNAATRAEGTSGSVFSAFAEQQIHDAGYVAGAVFSRDFLTVRHEIADTLEAAAAFHGSKYVQSTSVDCISDVLSLLRAGKRVLFSGTPCQVASLRRLTGNPDALVTCDFVCHGVPSPKVYRAYLAECQVKYSSQVNGLWFRDKTLGWNNPRVVLAFENGTTARQSMWSNKYFAGFSLNVFLRPSCYACPFATATRAGDLTMGDCWRVASSHPQYDDGKGTSLLLVNSGKGNAFLQTVCGSGSIFLGEYDLGLACASNVHLCRPALPARQRDLFFRVFNETGSFFKAARVYFTWRLKLRRCLVSMIKRLRRLRS